MKIDGKQVIQIILLVIIVILVDIWLIPPVMAFMTEMNRTSVMVGAEAANLGVAKDLMNNIGGCIKYILDGNFSKWFMASLVTDGSIAALFYIGITSMKNTKQINGMKINFSKTDGTYGTAQWMSTAELKGKDMKGVLNINGKDEIIFGRIPEEPKSIVTAPKKSSLNRNIAIYGAPGTGKSRGFVRPAALNLATAGESMIFTDPKGELYRSMAHYLTKQGYEVKVLNLVNMIYSDRWNPLSEVKDDLSAQTFAQVIIDNTSGVDTPQKADFWERTEVNLLKALALYVALELPKSEVNMKTLYSLVSSRDVKKTERIFSTLKDNHPALQPYNIYCQASEVVRTSAVIGLGTRLQVFQSKLVQDLTATSDINLNLPGVKKCAYFCIVSDMQSTFDFLSGLFFSFLFINLINLADGTSSGRCKIPVNFIMDEFPNIAKIPDFPKKISTARSRGINCMPIFQSIPQLQNRYKNMEWAEILGSCDTSLFLGCNDILTAEYITKILGTSTIEDKTVSREQGWEGLFDFGKRTDKVNKRNLLNPDEVMHFDNSNGILIVRGKNPLMLKKYDYSEHPRAKQLKEINVREYQWDWSEEYRQLELEELKATLRDLDIDYEEGMEITDEIQLKMIEAQSIVNRKIITATGISEEEEVASDKVNKNEHEEEESQKEKAPSKPKGKKKSKAIQGQQSLDLTVGINKKDETTSNDETSGPVKEAKVEEKSISSEIEENKPKKKRTLEDLVAEEVAAPPIKKKEEENQSNNANIDEVKQVQAPETIIETVVDNESASEEVESVNEILPLLMSLEQPTEDNNNDGWESDDMDTEEDEDSVSESKNAVTNDDEVFD